MVNNRFGDAYKEKLSAKDIKRLSLRDPKYWLKDAAIDWLVMFSAMALFIAIPNPITFVISILIIGNRQHALGLLGHDGTHYTLSYNRQVNDFLTNFFAWWPIGLTMAGYRNLHNMHHKYVGTPNDPEVIYKQLQAEQWHLPQKPKGVFKLAVKDLIGFGAKDYFTILLYAKPPENKSYIPLVLGHLGFLTLSVWAGYWELPAVWYTSMLTAFPMYFRLRLWLEHQGTDFVHRLKLNKIEGALFAPHLAWYHWEHHKYPTVPYCRLPEVRSMLPLEPVITLRELITSFKESDFIHSGVVFSEEKNMQSDETHVTEPAIKIAA